MPDQSATTMHSRVGFTGLRTGRHLARSGLARRGIALPAVLGLSALVGRSDAAVPVGLARATARAVAQYAGGKGVAAGAIPATAAVLLREVNRTMFATKCKIATALLLALG